MYAINKKITSKYALTIVFGALLSLYATGEEGDLESIEANTEGASSEMASKPAVKNLLLEKEKNWHSDLEKATEPHEHVWLDIQYTNSTAQHKALALKVPAKTPETQGAALIIPDTQQHSDWPGLVHQLRHSLPYAGWFSLSVSPPWPDLKAAPERQSQTKIIESYKASTEITKATALGSRAQRNLATPKGAEGDAVSTESAAENISPNEELPVEQDGDVDINLTGAEPSKEKRAPYEERLMTHLEMGLAHLEQEGYQNIVIIAFGESAFTAINHANKVNTEGGDTGFSLILIEPKLSAITNDNFAEQVGKRFSAPILDIFRPSDLKQREGARSRKVSANVAEFANYHQLRLSAPAGTGSENFLTKRIGDWLNRYAPGQTQKNKRGG